jgi:hypothetical protein
MKAPGQLTNHPDGQGSFWATITAVLAVVCTIGVLYLPIVL